MYVATKRNSILEQTHAVYNAAWVVSDSYIASYFFPYFLCQSLATSLFKFKNSLYILYTLLHDRHG